MNDDFSNFTNYGTIHVVNNVNSEKSKPKRKKEGSTRQKKLPSRLETIFWNMLNITTGIIMIIVFTKILFFSVSPEQLPFLIVVATFVSEYLKIGYK